MPTKRDSTKKAKDNYRKVPKETRDKYFKGTKTEEHLKDKVGRTKSIRAGSAETRSKPKAKKPQIKFGKIQRVDPAEEKKRQRDARTRKQLRSA